MPTYGITDVDYPAGGGARGALLTSRSLDFAEIEASFTVEEHQVAPYVPGQFYLREMPVIVRLLEQAPPLDLLIVDGYVDLTPEGKPGLGRRISDARGLPVIGIAKSSFASATHAVPVTRGTSRRPLYVTAAGLSLDEAAQIVWELTGQHRIPEAVRLVDRLARAR